MMRDLLEMLPEIKEDLKRELSYLRNIEPCVSHDQEFLLLSLVPKGSRTLGDGGNLRGDQITELRQETDRIAAVVQCLCEKYDLEPNLVYPEDVSRRLDYHLSPNGSK